MKILMKIAEEKNKFDQKKTNTSSMSKNKLPSSVSESSLPPDVGSPRPIAQIMSANKAPTDMPTAHKKVVPQVKMPSVRTSMPSMSKNR